MTAARGGSATFSSLRIRNYRIYFIGQSVSIAGTWMQNIALSWYVLELSHSGTVLGLFTGLRFAPLLLFGGWGGVYADRTNKRRLLFATQTVAGVISLMLAVLVAAGSATLASVMVMGALLGCVNVFDNPARQSFINEMVTEGELANAITLNSISANVARVVGPVVSGVIISTVGVSVCFAVNAGSFAAVIVSLAMIDRSKLRPDELAVRARRQVREGLLYVRSEPGLLVPLLLVAIAGAFAWEIQITLPLMARAFHGGAALLGWMMAASGAGAILGGLITARRSRLTPRSAAAAAIGWGATIILAALAPNIATELAILFVVGYGTISFNSISKTCLQQTTVGRMRGRVMSLWAIAWQGTTPIGGPIVGWFGQAFGARWSLLAGGIPTAVAGVAAFVYLNRGARQVPAEGAPAARPATPVSDEP
jgi:MFS family permease